MSLTPAVVVPAPAKLNLGLEVLNRRADGYHNLATIFLTVSLFDEVAVASVPGIAASSPDVGVPPWENLTMRAAQAMQAAFPGRGADITLTKRIPVAAGLGGASSDAAGTLLALRELWQTSQTLAELAALAALLGSDVPFLVTGGCALGSGRGEVLEALPLPGESDPHTERNPHPNPSPFAKGEGLPPGGDAATGQDSQIEPPPTSPLALRKGRGAGGEGLSEATTAASESPSPAHRERGWGEGFAVGNEAALTILIVAPRVVIPRKTPSLFAALQPGDFSDGASVAAQSARLRAGQPLDPTLLGNAFQRALYDLRPDVKEIAAAISEAGAQHVALSGAGPAHYALFTNPAEARGVERRLTATLGDRADCFVVVPVPARPEFPPSDGVTQP
ncbi:MAG: 4-(cytidine 5'-diphospho)-2-C-methyl-D-erythritol kinase [Thermomicrobiales bacterium]